MKECITNILIVTPILFILYHLWFTSKYSLYFTNKKVRERVIGKGIVLEIQDADNTMMGIIVTHWTGLQRSVIFTIIGNILFYLLMIGKVVARTDYSMICSITGVVLSIIGIIFYRYIDNVLSEFKKES